MYCCVVGFISKVFCAENYSCFLIRFSVARYMYRAKVDLELLFCISFTEKFQVSWMPKTVKYDTFYWFIFIHRYVLNNIDILVICTSNTETYGIFFSWCALYLKGLLFFSSIFFLSLSLYVFISLSILINFTNVILFHI